MLLHTHCILLKSNDQIGTLTWKPYMTRGAPQSNCAIGGENLGNITSRKLQNRVFPFFLFLKLAN